MDDVHYCLPVINTVIINSCKFHVPYACKIFRGDDDGRGRRPGEKRNKRPTRKRNSTRTWFWRNLAVISLISLQPS